MAYTQNYLRNLNISSGELYIECPFNSGSLSLIDQASGYRCTYSNYHDVNIVSVPGGYEVMDVQFERGPMSLDQYLAQIEASQKLKPLNNRSWFDSGYCYWSIW